MTLDDKLSFINHHCLERAEGDCGKCSIYSLCATCKGDFESQPELIDLAIDCITTPKGSQDSKVTHPSHYNQGGIECWDAMISAFGKEAVETFCILNAFKYVWRADSKNGIEDIDKAINYLNKYKELVTNG